MSKFTGWICVLHVRHLCRLNLFHFHLIVIDFYLNFYLIMSVYWIKFIGQTKNPLQRKLWHLLICFDFEKVRRSINIQHKKIIMLDQCFLKAVAVILELVEKNQWVRDHVSRVTSPPFLYLEVHEKPIWFPNQKRPFYLYGPPLIIFMSHHYSLRVTFKLIPGHFQKYLSTWIYRNSYCNYGPEIFHSNRSPLSKCMIICQRNKPSYPL